MSEQDRAENEAVIGYSGLDRYEETYGYNEDACYIADTEASAHLFMREGVITDDYVVEPVTLSRIMNDYGCSLGEFAMEREAFARFCAAARQAGVSFQTRGIDGLDDLTLVNVDGVRLTEE